MERNVHIHVGHSRINVLHNCFTTHVHICTTCKHVSIVADMIKYYVALLNTCVSACQHQPLTVLTHKSHLWWNTLDAGICSKAPL